MRIEIELSGGDGLQWTALDTNRPDIIGGMPVRQGFVAQGTAKTLADASAAAGAAVREYLKSRTEALSGEVVAWS